MTNLRAQIENKLAFLFSFVFAVRDWQKTLLRWHDVPEKVFLCSGGFFVPLKNTMIAESFQKWLALNKATDEEHILVLVKLMLGIRLRSKRCHDTTFCQIFKQSYTTEPLEIIWNSHSTFKKTDFFSTLPEIEQSINGTMVQGIFVVLCQFHITWLSELKTERLCVSRNKL